MAQSLNYQNIQRQEGNWQIVVNPRPGSFEIEVWLINIESGKAKVANVNKDGYLELKEVKDETNPGPPFMRVPHPVWELIVNAIAEKTPPLKKEVVDAELSATKFHLEDMRKLVFEAKQLILPYNGKLSELDTNYSCGHGSCLPGKCVYKEAELKQKIKGFLGDVLMDGLREQYGDNNLAEKEQEEIVDRIVDLINK